MNELEQTFIDKLARDTLKNKYTWKQYSELTSSKNYFNHIPSVNTFDSYWFETDKHTVLLVSELHKNYSIILEDNKSKQSTKFSIPTTDYFRLKTIIDNYLGNEERLINDFFKE